MNRTRGDFTADFRLLTIAAIAIVVGSLCSVVAVVLLKLIDLFTNVFYYGAVSLQHRIPADHHLGWWSVLIPVAGGLIIGLMARYGSERIRGHGIPEAIEAILIGRSRMQPKVAVLKPLSSAISIGSGGPFGAEGPIIMTGGALGSLVASIPPDLRRAQDASGRGRGRRHVGDLRHAGGRRAPGRRAPALRVEAAQPDSRGAGKLRRGPAPTNAAGSRPDVPRDDARCSPPRP